MSVNQVAERLRRVVTTNVEFKKVLQTAVDEIERLEHNNGVLTDAVWKACGDDEESVNGTIESQGTLR